MRQVYPAMPGDLSGRAAFVQPRRLPAVIGRTLTAFQTGDACTR
ncbi:MAG: hypothetical protein ACKOC4_03665 [Planctomycetia bacterium]